MIPSFEKATLTEKQQYYYNGYYCIYCRKETELVSSLQVYQEDYGLLFLCRDCKAHVGTHNGGDQSYGTVAKKELRVLRHSCHGIFDPLWQLKVNAGSKKNKAQADARKWLADQLGIAIVETHIGMFSIEQCKKTIALCEEVWKNIKEKQELKNANEQFNSDMVNRFCEAKEISFQEFKAAGMHKFEIVHPVSKNKFNYYPRTDEYHWDNKKKKVLEEDIERFLSNNFQPQSNSIIAK